MRLGPRGHRIRGRSPGRGRERGPLGASGEPRRHRGWSPAEASVAPPGPQGAGGSPLWLRLLVRKGVSLAIFVPPIPSLPALPGSSGHQLSPDLAFCRLFLVQANSFDLRQETLGGPLPLGVCLSGVADGAVEMPATGAI